MLINKWLVTNFVDNDNYKKRAGVCLYLSREPNDIGKLYTFLNKQPVEKPFAILLSGDDFYLQNAGDTYIVKIIGLFFQPSYYLVNYQPVLFLNNRTPACTDFLDKLVKKGINQGLQNVLVLDTKIPAYADNTITQFAYQVNNSNLDYNLLLRNWLVQYLNNKNPTEIHLLISAKEQDSVGIFNSLLEKENVWKEKEDYKIASILYQKQKLIEKYEHELSLKLVSEKDNQYYLNIQKEERIKGIEWYHYEYEILPLWYKRFGHIIKVIMGKRTFRSLFNDNVKKYKD